MITELEAIARRRDRLLLHLSNVDYVANFFEHLRRVRGARSQQLIACMADVVQSYISRVERGSCSGIGYAALCRILDTYKEIECADRHY